MFTFDDNDAELDELRADAAWQRRQNNRRLRATGRSNYDPNNLEAPEAALDYEESEE